MSAITALQVTESDTLHLQAIWKLPMKLAELNPTFLPAVRRAIKAGQQEHLVSAGQADLAVAALRIGKPHWLKIRREFHKQVAERARLECGVRIGARFDWSTIWEWIKENLPEILKILMAIIALF